MKHRLILCWGAALCLSACALTPEQKAARAAEQLRYERELQVRLAAQCDKETADLMRRQFDDGLSGQDEKSRQDLRLRYVEKVNEPLFQACYTMAWQNHVNQQRLRRIERYYDDFYPWHRSVFWPWRYW